jgi:predicted molibdopterin-dependent oxidoreductase YjgC
MFRRLRETTPIAFTFEGEAVQGQIGDSVAAALLALGVRAPRDTAVSGAPRGPYCMMGVCFDCLVEIDGVANRQGCMVALTPGMVVRRQRGKRDV